MITGIIVALPEEITTLTKGKLNQGEVHALASDILLCYSGVGSTNASVAAKSLLDQGVQGLISWGCAAALIDELKPGDLVLASQLIAKTDVIYQADRQWQQQVYDLVSDHINISTANLAESSKLLASSEEKIALQCHTGAGIVDMESTAIARIATAQGVPFLAVRTVADSVQMSLPNAVAVALDSEGVVQLPKLLLHLLCHPAELPSLIRLGRSFSAAKKTLCLVAQQLAIIVSCSLTAS